MKQNEGQASPGSVVVVSGHRQGEPARMGEVLEVLGDPGREHFRVRWDDGRESLFYPGSDAHIRTQAGKRARA